MRKFAISDIHGCAVTFEALLEKIQFTPEDELYLLGDYIDRGPDSKGVIDDIWRLQDKGYQIQCLRGNHEQLMLDAQMDRQSSYIWQMNGGDKAMDSFGAFTYSEIPHQYIEWMEKLPYYFEVDNFILVHAGFKFDMPDPFMEKHAMIWQRGWYQRINYDWLGDRIIVHGHTPMSSIEIEKNFTAIKEIQYLDIDAGCVFKNRIASGGQLCALDMTNMKLIFQENIED